DVFVDSSTPTVNYDADARLRADASPIRVSYLRFAVTGVNGRAVQHARLRLEVTGPSVVSGGPIHRISRTTWDAAPVTYATPPAGAVVFTGDPVTLQASALAPVDGDASARVRWTSDVQGFLGAGAALTMTLVDGAHVVTASVTDSAGLTGSARVSLTVKPPPG